MTITKATFANKNANEKWLTSCRKGSSFISSVFPLNGTRVDVTHFGGPSIRVRPGYSIRTDHALLRLRAASNYSYVVGSVRSLKG